MRKVALIILDGWGIGPAWGGNAIVAAKTTNMDSWWRTYTHTTLLASGEAVGLPPDIAGNSETGHLNIGAGRVVSQDLVFINNLIKDGSFYKNTKILAAFEHVKKNNSALHLMGLVGTGCVHSDYNHLFSLLKMAKASQVARVYLDLFTDGRDSDPQSALGVLEIIQRKITEIGIGQITSICGRYFGMDRDRNWGRTSRAYNALTKGEAIESHSVRDAVSRSYLRNLTDEFIEPHIIVGESRRKILISDNDAIILFNYRPDRVRQISYAFSQEKIQSMPDKKILKNTYFVTFINRDSNPIGTMAFDPEVIKNALPEVISHAGLTQFHIAETEKYAHITYFIDGGREEPFPGEFRSMVFSPKVATYDLAPDMSAEKVENLAANNVLKNHSLMICNFANADMVGHSGNFVATVQAVECVDRCLGKLVKSMLANNYTIIVTADHGNAEEMLNPRTNQPQTEHTTNPVPFVIISKEIEIARRPLIPNGTLANIAPTILEIIGLQKPEEMTATSLFIKTNYGTK